jgi:hypothetical protein
LHYFHGVVKCFCHRLHLIGLCFSWLFLEKIFFFRVTAYKVDVLVVKLISVLIYQLYLL